MTTEANVIELQDLTKTFRTGLRRRRTRALRGLSLAVAPGDVQGSQRHGRGGARGGAVGLGDGLLRRRFSQGHHAPQGLLAAEPNDAAKRIGLDADGRPVAELEEPIRRIFVESGAKTQLELDVFWVVECTDIDRAPR